MTPFIIIGCFIFCCGLITGYFIGFYTRIPKINRIDYNKQIDKLSTILPQREHVFSSELEKKIDETLKLGKELKEYMRGINK